ncbi:MAG: ATP-binding protein [Paracoccaceae bacterium]|nr:ATP-binding protein [Paracoccaceae bacterium]
MAEKNSTISWRVFNMFLVLVVVILTTIIAYVYERVDGQRYRASLRGDLTQQASILRATMEGKLAQSAEIVKTVATLIDADPAVIDGRLSMIIDELLGDDSILRDIAIAPDLVVRHVYPLKGNETVLGLDYTKNREQFVAISQALAIGATVVAGPVKLVQGGEGFIIRTPVLSDNPDKQWWGIVSGVINTSTFYKLTGLANHSPQFDVALRGKDGTGANGAVFYGSDAVFRNDPVLTDVIFPNGSWQMAIAPKGGWPAHPPNFDHTRLIFILGALLTIFFVLTASRLAQKREQAENLLASAVDAVDAGLALFDENDYLVACNSTFQSYYGGKINLTNPRRRFIDILKDIANSKTIPEAIGREEEWVAERIHLHRQATSSTERLLGDGRWIRIEERRTPDGGTATVTVDITALKKAKEQAEQANRAKTEFLNTVTHELRTPLTVILGFTPLLANSHKLPSARKLQEALEKNPVDAQAIRRCADDLTEEISRYASSMDKAGRHLLSLINDILDLSKAESGLLALNPSACQRDRIVQEIVEQFQPTAEGKGLVLNFEPSGSTIMADRIRLNQILVNLVGNALKFTDYGEIRITTEDDSDFVKICVHDTGCGIPKESITDIFSVFTQADNSDTRRATGTGLGLAISRKLVELHGGRIWVESEPGKGSTFCFTMPKPGRA